MKLTLQLATTDYKVTLFDLDRGKCHAQCVLERALADGHNPDKVKMCNIYRAAIYAEAIARANDGKVTKLVYDLINAGKEVIATTDAAQKTLDIAFENLKTYIAQDYLKTHTYDSKAIADTIAAVKKRIIDDGTYFNAPEVERAYNRAYIALQVARREENKQARAEWQRIASAQAE